METILVQLNVLKAYMLLEEPGDLNSRKIKTLDTFIIVTAIVKRTFFRYLYYLESKTFHSCG